MPAVQYIIQDKGFFYNFNVVSSTIFSDIHAGANQRSCDQCDACRTYDAAGDDLCLMIM